MEKYEDLFQPTFLKKKESGSCKNRPALPYDATVTMSYIPLQECIDVYEVENALDNGTLYPVLNKEFMGRMVKK